MIPESRHSYESNVSSEIKNVEKAHIAVLK